MTDTHAPYTLYKMDISYFSGKLEAYLRAKGIPYTTATADARGLKEIYAATGVMKAPALKTADNQWLFDTTPTIEYLEGRYPESPILPSDPAQAFLTQLIEDYADEWLWRPAMWWRWEPLPTRKALGWRIALEVDPPGIPHALMAWFFAQRQRRTWIWGDGVDAGNADAVRDLYLDELDFLQPILASRPYLLGNQPSLADFGYFASMFRHFGNDPDPSEIMRRRAPDVYEWLARLWNHQPSPQTGETQWHSPEGPEWAPLWKRICGDYLPYLKQNAQAWQAGDKRFDSQGVSLSFNGTVTVRYRAWCLQRLQRAFAALDQNAQSQIRTALEMHGGIGPLDSAEIDSGLDALYQLPRPAGNHRPGLWLSLWGQPRN